ncbi:MAG: phage tail tape measure protein [Bacteroidetes bacterium]|nr:phage tail tape measure protein [Bacteroidota bacterium]
MARGKLQFDIIGDATKMAGSFLALGAVITVMSSAVRSLADFEQAMAKVAAISRSTEKEFAALRQNALDLGKSTVFTATQVASLEEAFARLGFTAREIINVSKDTLDIAAASGTALGRSAEIVGSTLRAFQLDVSQTQRVVDIMAGAFSTSALNMERFSVSMTPVAPIAAQLGISLTEVTAIMGLLADRGFEASVSGTAFRNILLLSAQAGITYQEALTKITDSTGATATALDLFGRRGAAVASTLAGLTDEIEDQIIALDDMSDEAARQAEIMQDTLIGDWLKFTSALDGAIQKGTGLVGVLRDITQGMTDAVTGTNQFTRIVDEKLFKKIPPTGRPFTEEEQEL